MKFLSSCLLAFAMYSRIPVPQMEFKEEHMKYSMCFFSLIGVVIGAAVWLWYQAGRYVTMSPAFVTVIAVLIPIALTGGIHMDGFMDTTDARSSYRSREAKLKIMADPHVGAFAVLGCGCYMLLAYGIWSAAEMEMLPVLSAGFVLSRVLSAGAVIWFPQAKAEGSAATFAGAAQKKGSTIAIGLTGFICVIWMLYHSVIYGGAALVGAGAVFIYYRRRIVREFGGITGDLAGWFLQVCELLMAGCVIAVKIVTEIL